MNWRLLRPGTLVTMSGRGWPAGDTVIISLDDLGSASAPLVYVATTVSERGSFLASFPFPDGILIGRLAQAVLTGQMVGLEQPTKLARKAIHRSSPSWSGAMTVL